MLAPWTLLLWQSLLVHSVVSSTSSVCSLTRTVYRRNSCCEQVDAPPECDGQTTPSVSEALAAARVNALTPMYVDVAAAYDLTEVVLSDGTCLRPLAFGSTLPHPSSQVPAPTCESVDALHDFVRACPFAEWNASIASLLYAPVDALLPTPGSARTTDFSSIVPDAEPTEYLETLGLSLLRDCDANDLTPCSANATLVAAVANRTIDTLLDWTGFAHSNARPRLSAFWSQPLTVGATVFSDRRVRVQADDTRLWTRQGAQEDAQGTLASVAATTLVTENVQTLRSLASAVDSEPVYSHYLHAAYVMLATLPVRLRDEVGGVRTSLHGGYDDVLVLVAEAARAALADSYRGKYLVTQRLRPAAYLRLVDAAEATDAPAALRTLVQATNASAAARTLREAVRAHVAATVGESNFLLPMMYRTSRHPSKPHGHATVAGACVTVLKGVLRTVDDDGTLVQWESTTYVAELDKLAFNVALGRNVAGQHVRSEAESSLVFGETIALQLLRSRACAGSADARAAPYPAPVVPLFNGSVVRVTCDAIVLLSTSVLSPPSPVPTLVPPPFQSPPDPPATPPPPPSGSVPMLTPIASVASSSAPLSMEPEVYRRIWPIPALTMIPASRIDSVARIDVVQRQMSFGDSTTKRAVLSLNNGAITRTVSFGVPGSETTRLVDFATDALGRDGMPDAVTILFDDPINITQVEYTVHEVYPFRPPTAAPREYGGRGTVEMGKYGPTSVTPGTSLSTPTDLFYGAGTADVGLVRMAMYTDPLGLALVPEYTLSSVEDTSTGYTFPDEDAPSNPFRNPYRTTNCDRASYLGSFGCTPSESDAFYVQSAWPCAIDDSTSVDCSLQGLPKSYSFPGWGVRAGQFGYSLLPQATSANFARLHPKPQWRADFAPAIRATAIGVRQRQMAYLDATMRTASLCIDDACQTIQFDTNDGTVLQSNFTFPSADIYGRAGWAEELRVELGGEMDVHSIVITVEDVYEFTPPVVYANDTWGVDQIEVDNSVFFDYVYPTMGTWNVGLTTVALYDAGGLVNQSRVLETGTATSNGAFSFVGSDGVDVFHPSNALLNAYANHSDPHVVPNSWCWHGFTALRGAHGHVFLSEETPPPASAPTGPPEAIGEPGR